jgi:hypothetical protein
VCIVSERKGKGLQPNRKNVLRPLVP